MTHAEFRERMGLGEFAIGLDWKTKKPEFNFMNLEEEEENAVVVATNTNNLLLRGSEPSAMTERRHLLSNTNNNEEEDVDLGCDWHAKGFIGPIRQQGQCGACWAFSAIGAIESAMAINKYNSLPPSDRDRHDRDDNKSVTLGLVTPLSEQDLIDCDTKFEKGCKGGLMTSTFNEEEHSRRGICSESDYPYLETQGTCSNDLCTPVTGSIVKNQVDVVPRKTHALERAIQIQPVTAAMVANDPMFQFYSKGIYQSEGCGRVTKQMGDPDCGILYDDQDVCIPDINHGVLVVGYGIEESATSKVKKYFKVKNSWGSSWGEGGFFRIARYDEDKTDPMENWGECAILTLLSYPIMK
jgi:C1A family cysteine protease